MKKKYYYEKSRSKCIYICMCIQWWIYVCINRLKKKTNLPPTPWGLFNSQWVETWISKLFLAANTQLFFAGSPYAMILSKAARIRQMVKSRTKRSGRDPYTICPLIFEAMQRIKQVSLPDGTKCSLSVTWKMDPHFQMIKEVVTQKSEDVFQVSVSISPTLSRKRYTVDI